MSNTTPLLSLMTCEQYHPLIKLHYVVILLNLQPIMRDVLMIYKVEFYPIQLHSVSVHHQFLLECVYESGLLDHWFFELPYFK